MELNRALKYGCIRFKSWVRVSESGFIILKIMTEWLYVSYGSKRFLFCLIEL